MLGLTDATLCYALFASDLQPSQYPDAENVRSAIAKTILAVGARDCAARMAQEFGDHPDAAIVRMRWARQAVRQAYDDRNRCRLESIDTPLAAYAA